MSKFVGHSVAISALGLGYFLAGQLGLVIGAAEYMGATGIIWPPAGVALAALLRWGVVLWPGVVLGSAALWWGMGFSWVEVASATAGGTAMALAGVWLLRRNRLFNARLLHMNHMLTLLLYGGAVAGLLGAGVAMVGTQLGTDHARQPLTAGLSVWLGNTSGVLLIAPMLLVWGAEGSARRLRRPSNETLAALALLVLATGAAFGLLPLSDLALPLAFAPVPVLVWIALRLPLQWVAAAVVLVVVIAGVGTSSGHGPFASFADPQKQSLMWAFVLMVGLTTLLLGFTVTGRRRAIEHLRDLAGVVERIGSVHSLEELTKIVRRAARELTGADGATVVLREGDQCHYVDQDAIGPLWKGQRFPLDVCISGWAMLHDETVTIEDIYDDPRIPQEAYRPTFVRSLAMVPIGHGEPCGAIGCYWASHHRPSSDELDMQKALAEATAVGLDNIDLYQRLDALRRDAELTAEELSVSEERNRLLFEQARTGIAEASLDERLLRFSPGFERMLGYSEAELLGRRFSEITHPDDVAESLERFRRLAAGEINGFEVRKRYLCKDGSIRWGSVSTYAIRTADGRPQRVAAIVQDVTEQVLAEQALCNSEHFKERVLEASLNGLCLYDLKESRYDFINKQFTTLTGYSLQDLNALTLDEYLGLFHPGDVERIVRHRDALARATDDEALDIEYRFRRSDGRWIWLLSHDSVFERDADGSVRQVLGSFIDVTARREAETEERRQRVELDKVQQRTVVADAITTVADQLSQPLTALTNYCETALWLVQDSAPELCDALESACEEAQRAGAVARRLRDMIAEEQGTRQPVDLDELINRTILLVGAETVRSGAKIRYDAATTTARVLVDPRQIEQVLFALLNNSLEAMQRAAVPIREIVIRTYLDNGQVGVTVEDTGPGLTLFPYSEEYDFWDSSHHHGTGINLAVCRSILEAHGSDLRAETGCDEGTVMRFGLPLASSEEEQSLP